MAANEFEVIEVELEDRVVQQEVPEGWSDEQVQEYVNGIDWSSTASEEEEVKVASNDPNQPFIDFLEVKEGLRLKTYLPTKGDKLTIGYGHTGDDVKQGMTWTKEQADKALKSDVEVRVKEITTALPEFNSFSDELRTALFGEWYRGSLVQSKKTRRLINDKKYADAAKEFLNNDEYKNAVKNGRAGIRPRMEKVAEELTKLGNRQETDVGSI